jgi:(E)-4-hydroxy-3-methylbut-2-enyl-diphosphate synthase
MHSEYIQNFTRYLRRTTYTVDIGGIPLGSDYPIRVQSMTNTPTVNVDATVEQIIRMFEAGAHYARVTVPSVKDAEALSKIKNLLRERNYTIPLIADIHFNPKLAFLSAAVVDKVRINPGNYIDRKRNRSVGYSYEDYQQELGRLQEKFIELLELCKKHGTSLRIGTNHGSLSDRIMDRFGDTPEGMAESAMEFLRICKTQNFTHVVVSMKASNTRIMVYATRLLVKKMNQENMQFPVHLGVTEAGEGEDGRIKSAVGIGALLSDGIGDTLRVSLTEDPEAEIPVAKKFVEYISKREEHEEIPDFGKLPISPYEHKKYNTRTVGNVGGHYQTAVVTGWNGTPQKIDLANLGWEYSDKSEWHFKDTSPDILIVDSWSPHLEVPKEKKIISHSEEKNPAIGRILNWETYITIPKESRTLYAVEIPASELDKEKIERIKRGKNLFIILSTRNANGFTDQRAALFRLRNAQCAVPVIIKRQYSFDEKEDFQLAASTDLGGLFIDGLGDGIWLENKGFLSSQDCIETAFGILQASRTRISKTEYISCPSCGRTLFDLQSTTRKIRERTAHLKGLKIGIMGCIVNGPGEMADADYGYVGTGRGKVTLYKEKEVVKRNIPETEAVEELIKLIKENGDWVEP